MNCNTGITSWVAGSMSILLFGRGVSWWRPRLRSNAATTALRPGLVAMATYCLPSEATAVPSFKQDSLSAGCVPARNQLVSESLLAVAAARLPRVSTGPWERKCRKPCSAADRSRPKDMVVAALVFRNLVRRSDVSSEPVQVQHSHGNHCSGHCALDSVRW